jgi:hypothetical protein
MDNLKCARNVDFQSFLAIFTQHDPLKGAKFGHMGAYLQIKMLLK